MKDLGWMNEPQQRKQIEAMLTACDILGHRRKETNGSQFDYSGWRVYTCDECGFKYSVDSSG